MMCSCMKTSSFCCYAEICTALRREHDFCRHPRPKSTLPKIYMNKSPEGMLPKPYFLQGKTKICTCTKTSSFCWYAEICTALRREHDFCRQPKPKSMLPRIYLDKSLDAMVAKPYFLQGKTMILNFT